MEFDLLPKAKFYSPKQNGNKQDQHTTTTNNQTVNININDKVDKVDEVKTTETIKTKPEKAIEFLKLVLESYINNPVKLNELVICQKENLAELVKVLVGCDEVVIETEDIDLSCCGSKSKFIPVSKIWVKNGDVSEVFKYKYSQYLEIFEAYKISLKYVYCE